MRKVDYNRFLQGDTFESWRKRAERARNRLFEVVEREGAPQFNKKIWTDLKDDFLSPGNFGKCMYCEGIYDAGNYSDAEHFRPKAKVTENGTEIDHPGYYWLAYEWQNLLLSCTQCNSSPGKQNEFPIAGRRVQNPDADPGTWWEKLKVEKPLLLHPYFDDPEEHFDAGQYGALEGKTKRGRATIEVCALNRTKLMRDRRRAEEILANRLKKLIDKLMDNDSLDDEIFGAEDAFSIYLNCRASQCFRALHEKYQ